MNQRLFLWSILSLLLVFHSCNPTNEPINEDEAPSTFDFTPSGTLNGHDYVDLGLSVKWATTNVGAKQPSDIGNYYAWQETTPYNEGTWMNYKLNGFNPCDPNNILSSIYDAAHVNWGKGWKMPTTEEQQELVKPENCIWTWTDNFQESGQPGYIVTSKKTKKSIFLAAGKYIKHETFSTPSKLEGYYWSSWAGPQNMWKQHLTAMCMYFMDGGKGSTKYAGTNANCADGLPIRPVVGDAPVYIPETTLPLDQSLTNTQGYSVCGKKSGKTFVDLGLPSRTMWATYNVGASAPSEYGDAYAWGETSPKSLYSYENYKYFLGYSDVTGGALYSKYVYYAPHGVCDYKMWLDPEDDAATVNWGAEWEMPTTKQIEEIADYCIWKEKNLQINGKTVHGCVGYSKINGNTIFLPAGDIFYEAVPNDRMHVWNWSKDINGSLTSTDGTDYRANIMVFDNKLSAIIILDTRRPQGLSVRAVVKK